MKTFRYLFLAAFAAVLMALGGCGGSGDGSDSGTVQLAITDAVDHNYSKVVVSIKEIRAVPAGAEEKAEEIEMESTISQQGVEEQSAGQEGLPLIVSFDDPEPIDITTLVFQQKLLGETILSSGSYNQLRLVLEENTDPENLANYIVLADDPTKTPIPLFIPSGTQSGLKIVGKFDVVPGEITAVVLDFDPARIIKAGNSGQWHFEPTGIRVVQTDSVLYNYNAISGSLVQEVEDSTGAITLVPVTEATVYAYPDGSETAIAAGSVNTEDGTFRLFLPEGSYEIRATADGFEPLSTAPIEVIENLQDAEAGELVMIPVPETIEAL